MELFPASNDDQWSLIKKVIDDCDYYIVIIGGRYGSVNSEGISYTEMEYRYAQETGKPIIAFLHKKPEEIKSKDTEQTAQGKAKLADFRHLAEEKMVRYWSTPSDLGSVVSRSMIKLIKGYPAIGWVKADEAINEISSLEIIKLKEENLNLKNQIAQNANVIPAGTEGLAQGEDEIAIMLYFRGQKKEYSIVRLTLSVTSSWNKIFAALGPYLTNEADEESMQNCLVDHLQSLVIDELRQFRGEYQRLDMFNVNGDDFQRVKIQFKALGLIQKSNRGKSVKDKKSYWTLTPYGDHIMTQLVAIKKHN